MSDPTLPDTNRRALLGGMAAMIGVSPGPAAGQQPGATDAAPKHQRGPARLYDAPFGARGDGRLDDSAAVRSAFAYRDSAREGPFTVVADEGTFRLSGTGRTLVSIRSGTRFLGASLEGTRFSAAPDATAGAMISDDSETSEGSAAKVEIYNLTLDGANNRYLHALLDLGTGKSWPFGVYGRIDNLMGRDAPNATAFNLAVNIAVVGDVYSVNTRDGIVTADGGVGCHIGGAYPYEFSRYGIRLGGIGDNVLNGEGEAPTSADAVYIYGSRSFVVGLGSHILSVAKGTTLKRPFVIDTAAVGDWVLGPWQFIRSHNDQRFGDFDKPVYAGRATAVGMNTLEDTTKHWEVDELKGWAIRITAGAGAENWAEIAHNSANTITLGTSDWASAGPVLAGRPSAGSQYAIAPALCRAAGGGFASSKVLTLAEAVIRALFVRTLRVGSVLIGASNAAATIRGVIRLTTRLDRSTIEPRGRFRHVVTDPSIQADDFVTVSAPVAREAGLWIGADAVNGAVVLFIDNPGDRPVTLPATVVALLITQAG